MINIERLSDRYNIRVLNISDVDEILGICQQNALFYQFTDAKPTREQILDDMRITPPGIDHSAKYFFGYFDNGELIAVMDLVDGYPDPETAYIGFFMMKKQFQGMHIGTAIINDLTSYLETTGKNAVRLAIDKGNPQSTYFWKKNGFAVISEVNKNGRTKLVAEKSLRKVSCGEGMRMESLKTKRLILRRWNDSDAESLYEYAKDPDVGPIAGWPAHRSIEESLSVIRNVFSGKEAYAICLKGENRAIGAIELKLNGHTNMTDRDDECELGYWLGKPFWGQGFMPEAVNEMLRHAFEDIGMTKVWCGYYDGNLKSKRVQEKCGFRWQWKKEGVDVPLLNDKRTEHVSCITKEQWTADRICKGQEDKKTALLDLICSRHSYRGRYKSDAVSRKDLKLILEAGLAAPSGCNKQTTSLIAVDDPAVLTKIHEVIDPPVGVTAPAMICVLTRPIIAYRDRCFAVQDYAAAIENMLLAITALGYQSCWYEGHITDADRIGDRIAKILGVPDDYELVCILPVGIAESEPSVPKKMPFEDRAWFNGFQHTER